MAQISEAASEIVSSIIAQKLLESMAHDETPTPPGTMISFGSFIDKSRRLEQTLPSGIYIGDVTRALAESENWAGITVKPILNELGERMPERGTVSAVSRIKLG